MSFQPTERGSQGRVDLSSGSDTRFVGVCVEENTGGKPSMGAGNDRVTHQLRYRRGPYLCGPLRHAFWGREMSTEDKLRRALEEISALHGQTLIAPSLGPDADRGHQLGAYKAFNQAAEIAREALAATDNRDAVTTGDRE